MTVPVALHRHLLDIAALHQLGGPAVQAQVQAALQSAVMPDQLLFKLNDLCVEQLPRLSGPYTLHLSHYPARLGLPPGACGPCKAGYHSRRNITQDIMDLYWRHDVQHVTYLATDDEQRRWPLHADALKYGGVHSVITQDPACLHRPGVVLLPPDSPWWP